jgi:hypothetical protein
MPQTFLVPVVPRCLARLWLWRVALLVGLALSLASGAQAATTWTVCASGCDYSSIKAAIAASTTHNGDTLAIAAGTYTEAGISVNKSLTLQGAGAASTIVQAATTPNTAPDRVFTIASGVTVTIRKLTIRYGLAPGYPGGGGLYNAGTLTLTNSAIRSNAAIQGGGLENSGTLTLLNSTVSGNVAQSGGGGGIVNFSTMTLINSTVSGNKAPSDGGGLVNAGTLTLANSTVSGNKTSGSGGGLVNAGTLTLTNSTVSGNSATSDGGGIENYPGTTGATNLTNSTISGNSATRGGGLASSGTLTLANSIVANNPNGGNCFNYAFLGSAPITSHGYNLDSDGSCQLTAPTDQPSTDPLLGPLQNNGGPTLTRALLPGSPAIDAIPWGTNGCGTTLIGDQRWQARPPALGGHCDLGAYEVAVAGQALSGWVAGLTPQTVLCKNVTTGHTVTISSQAQAWDCEAAGLAVTPGDQVFQRVQGPLAGGATDVGGTVTGMVPSGGGCTNLTTGQQVPFQALFQGMQGATAASCVVAGLVVHAGDTIQINVQGVAE